MDWQGPRDGADRDRRPNEDGGHGRKNFLLTVLLALLFLYGNDAVKNVSSMVGTVPPLVASSK